MTTKRDLRIVYMGTPDFAVESLRRLVEGGYNIVGVITMPDKPVGRHGNTLQPSPVKQYAVAHGLTVLQPVRLKDEVFIQALRDLRADLQVVVAFRMLPEVVWSMPRLGTFNLHASLLPQYRGAAPINWAIINGEAETGITTFFLQHEIDTGEIISQVRIPITEDDNAETVHERLMMLGGDLVVETVDNILSGQVQTTDQSLLTNQTGPLKPAPKIFHDTCRINWPLLTTKQAYDFIRGLSPYPTAWTTLDHHGRLIDIKIYECAKDEGPCTTDAHPPGDIISDGKSFLKVRTADGFLSITSLQQAGKRRMSICDFMRGFKFENGMKFA